MSLNNRLIKALYNWLYFGLHIDSDGLISKVKVKEIINTNTVIVEKTTVHGHKEDVTVKISWDFKKLKYVFEQITIIIKNRISRRIQGIKDVRKRFTKKIPLVGKLVYT